MRTAVLLRKAWPFAAGCHAVLLLVGPAVLAQPVFTDATQASGLLHQQHTPPAPAIGQAPLMTGGAAVGDIDGDGDLDVFLTCLDGPDSMYENRGDGTFLDVTTQSGLGAFVLQSNGAAFADLDNDGDEDLVVTVVGAAGDPVNNRNYLFVNDGSGTFTEEAVSRAAAVSDAAARTAFSVAVGDYDRDGWLDLHFTEWLPGAFPHARLLRNKGIGAPGAFEDVTVPAGVAPGSVQGFSSAFSDLDGDGWPDLALAADFGTSRLYWNRGDGTFEDGTELAGVGTDENGMGSTIGDFDGDGDLDWFVTSIFDDDPRATWGITGNRLYRNDGDRVFVDATDAAGVREGYWGWGTAFFDYDNDGDLDLVMTNGVDFDSGSALEFVTDPMRLWRNDGSGAMTEVSAAAGLIDTDLGKGLVVFDYDGDGDLDLLVANNGQQARLWRNDGGNANDWLRVTAVGSWSNRSGIGARVVVRALLDGPAQLREIGSASHFLGQGERAAHIGLGSRGAAPVARVEVRWPSGRVQWFSDVPRNTMLVAVEADCVDGDGDSFCSSADCDDSLAAVYPGAAEINDGIDNQCDGDPGSGLVDETGPGSGFHDPADRDRYSWPAQAGAAAYEVARSGRADFSSDCILLGTVEPAVSDPDLPAAGDVFHYLNRALRPHPGSWGSDHAGQERSFDCP